MFEAVLSKILALISDQIAAVKKENKQPIKVNQHHPYGTDRR